MHFLEAIYGSRNVFHSRLELERKKLRIVARLEVAAMEPKGPPAVSASTCSPVFGRSRAQSRIAWSRHFAARELNPETEVQTRFLHLFGDFSPPAISRHMSGNSADISKRYFQNCTVGSNPPWSASKSLILQYKIS